MIPTSALCVCRHGVEMHSSVTGLCVQCQCRLLRIPRKRFSISRGNGNEARNRRNTEKKKNVWVKYNQSSLF